MIKKYMKIVITLQLLLIMVAPLLAGENERPKIGLVLSGGGARGLAHVSILKMIDSLNIPIDFVVGTSMGGIAGALYAIGYSGEEIEELALGNDWLELLSDVPARNMLPYIEKKDDGKFQLEFDVVNFRPVPPSGLIHGQKISLRFSKLTYAYEHITDFDQLPIPYRCLAVDLLTGDEIVLKSGSLAKAMRSTMSIPSLFTPVDWGDYMLIDGGLLNNLPIDVAVEMGADIIIAVNVGRPKRQRHELNTILEILEQSITIPEYNRQAKNAPLADILIAPQLEDLSPADFSHKNIEEIVRRGKKSAHDNLDKLIELKNNLMIFRNESKISSPDSSLIIYGVTISGNTSLPFTYIYNLLNIKPGGQFDPDSVDNHVREMYKTDYFKKIDYEVQPVKLNFVRLFFRIKELQKPVIHNVTISGNQNLSFGFIYSLLGIAPLDLFDTEFVEQRITELYSLGYFETINYEIETVSKDSIRLNIKVKEHAFNRLRLGLRYDRNSSLVGMIGFFGNNILLPGLRLEQTIQFAGLTRFNTKLFLPSRMLNLAVYPFIRFGYIDEPVNIFNQGQQIALYKSQSITWGAGVGFIPLKCWDTEIEYVQEFASVFPDIGVSGSLPDWDEMNRRLHLNTKIDCFDDVLLPRKGFLINFDYDYVPGGIGSEITYRREEIKLDIYHTIKKRHTFRFLTQYGYYHGNSATYYKWMYFGGPQSFVGLDYNELAYYRSSFYRFDYRYQGMNPLFLKFIFNIAPNYSGDYYPIEKDRLIGYGIGFVLLTPLGPLEMIYSRGDEMMSDSMQDHLYFTFGYKF